MHSKGLKFLLSKVTTNKFHRCILTITNTLDAKIARLEFVKKFNDVLTRFLHSPILNELCLQFSDSSSFLFVCEGYCGRNFNV